MKKPSQLGNLSKLQQLILVALLEENHAKLSRRAFRRLIKAFRWGVGLDSEFFKPTSSARCATSSLARAISRLEARRLILRTRSGWQLSDSASDLPNSGWMFALLSWRNSPELYALLGLRGPNPKSWLSVEQEQKPQRNGVQVELIC